MNKKIILCIIVILLLLITIVYYRPMQVTDLIAPYNSEVLPDRINSYIYFTSLSEKELTVNGKESIKEIVMLLENMKVRKKLTSPNPYIPKLKNSYRLEFYRGNDVKQRINILNSRYIEINHKVYTIIGKPNLSGLYKMIILDQPEGLLDDFYYDVIDIND